jgi:hypothetical protein
MMKGNPRRLFSTITFFVNRPANVGQVHDGCGHVFDINARAPNDLRGVFVVSILHYFAFWLPFFACAHTATLPVVEHFD